MRRRMTTWVAALALVLAAAPTRAAGPVVDWDPAFFYFPGATATNQPAGGILRCVGVVSVFGPPLEFLNALMPATEFTFYLDGLESLGTTAFGPPETTVYTTFYTGGTIEVYADPSPDAVFDPIPPNANVPSTFLDEGLPLLTGNFTSLLVTTNNFTAFQTGSIEGDIAWTGGTEIGRFDGGGGPCPGLFTGGATWNTSPGVGIPGYLFRHDGKIDLQCPTPARKSTWGRLKGLYR